MSHPENTRKLAAVLAADVSGYSRLMAQDDEGTVADLNASRAIFQDHIDRHKGHVIDMAGDSVLAEFASALEAVQCADEIQAALALRNEGIPENQQMRFRIGVNVGDILQQADGKIYGDGVNIAARLESIGNPGGITVSGTVYDQVKNRLSVGFEFIGEQVVKNIPEPVRAYRITRNHGITAPHGIGGYYGVLRQHTLAVAKGKPPSELSSYDCVSLGMGYYRALSLQTFRAARDCAEAAVKADPDYAPLWKVLTSVYRGEFQFGYEVRSGSLDRSLRAAQEAVRLGPDDPDNHIEMALTQFFRGDVIGFKASAERALSLSPKGSNMFASLGLYLQYIGEWDKGLAIVEQAKDQDPFFPGWYQLARFHYRFKNAQYDEALSTAKKINLPDYIHGHCVTIAALGQLGRAAEAKPIIDRIFKLDPKFDARSHWKARFQFQPDYLERLLDGMRKAGMPISKKTP